MCPFSMRRRYAVGVELWRSCGSPFLTFKESSLKNDVSFTWMIELLQKGKFLFIKYEKDIFKIVKERTILVYEI